MWQFVSQITRDTSSGIASSIGRAACEGRLGPMFDAISAVACQQFMLLPYYFALFHQNRERHLLGRITGKSRRPTKTNLRLGVFTDTFDETNGVGRFIAAMGNEAASRDLSFIVHTCAAEPKVKAAYRKNFAPAASCKMPHYPQLSLSMPPLAEVMEWADRQQFDAIHVHTPGPMGLCGMMVAAMLRVPLLATYHTDFPAYVFNHTADHRLTTATASYMKWFYGRADSVLTRSHAYEQLLAVQEICTSGAALPPCVNTETFSPRHRDVHYWVDRQVRQPHRLLYCGRVSAEKNLGVIVEAFRELCQTRSDTALIIAGDGPQLPALRKQLANLPVHFVGALDDWKLAPLYANCDLLLFPSRTDTLGQVVLEAQASGLPVLVSDEGGPREAMDDGITGMVLPAREARAWTIAINELLADEPRRQRMARTAPHRVSRCTPARTFDAYWDAHLQAAEEAQRRHCTEVQPQPTRSDAVAELVGAGGPA